MVHVGELSGWTDIIKPSTNETLSSIQTSNLLKGFTDSLFADAAMSDVLVDALHDTIQIPDRVVRKREEASVQQEGDVIGLFSMQQDRDWGFASSDSFTVESWDSWDNNKKESPPRINNNLRA